MLLEVPNTFSITCLDLSNLKVGKFAIKEEIYCVPPIMISTASCPPSEYMTVEIHKWCTLDLCWLTGNGSLVTITT